MSLSVLISKFFKILLCNKCILEISSCCETGMEYQSPRLIVLFDATKICLGNLIDTCGNVAMFEGVIQFMFCPI